MSNISQASKNLKKKLSFDDYSTPASQQDVTQAHPHYSTPVGQQDVAPVLPHTSAPVGQQDLTTVLSHTSTADIPASKQIKHTDSLVSKHAGTQVGQDAGEMVQQPSSPLAVPSQGKAVMPKTKATFYLSEEDSQALTDMFIKRLQNKNKTDKSALIAEAIQLLYKQEMKQST